MADEENDEDLGSEDSADDIDGDLSEEENDDMITSPKVVVAQPV